MREGGGIGLLTCETTHGTLYTHDDGGGGESRVERVHHVHEEHTPGAEVAHH